MQKESKMLLHDADDQLDNKSGEVRATSDARGWGEVPARLGLSSGGREARAELRRKRG